MKYTGVAKQAYWPVVLLLSVTMCVGCQRESQQDVSNGDAEETRSTDSESAPVDEADAKPAAEPETGIAGPTHEHELDGEARQGEQTETPRADETETPDTPDAETDPETPDGEAGQGDAAESGDPSGFDPGEEPTPKEGEPDLGPPLVDKPERLKRLDETRPLWIDAENKRIVMVGQVCQTEAALELFACLRDTKEHEAIVTVDVQAAIVHAGLLRLGAQPGHPAKWNPTYRPAAGTEIEVTVAWKDKQGKRQTAPAQDWIRDSETGEAMKHGWVFAGSGFWKDEDTGKEYYQAEGGDFICVSNFTTAMLDLPIESSQLNDTLMYRAFTDRIPPRGTPVTLILTPKPEKDAE